MKTTLVPNAILKRKSARPLMAVFAAMQILTVSLVMGDELPIGETRAAGNLSNTNSAAGPGTSLPHLVTDIALTPSDPNILRFGQNVNITFNYTTTEAGGVRIFARPVSGVVLTPNFAAHGSPLYPVGSGTGTGSFTISSGAATVDKIRFQILNANQTALLFQTTIPVHYKFR
jgi:hypothetical protein